MTDFIYFDTDCLSAFLWVKAECLISSLYSGKMVIPQPVYNELSNPGTPQLKIRADALINNNDAVIQPILTDTVEYKLYNKLTSNPDEGHVIIGKGEASALALASVTKGTVASNNLKDVAVYVSELCLRHITTGDILIEAFKKSLITENDGNVIWSAMLRKLRRIGATSFTDYLSSYKQ